LRLLIVTAVSQERDAVLRGLNAPHEVRVVGVGPATAAAATARILADPGAAFDGVVNAGIAGGVPGRVAIGEAVVATQCVSAELGVRLSDRFQPLDELGFATSTVDCAGDLTAGITAARGQILTLSTITGTPELATELAGRYPAALAEAMEGFGVAMAAAGAGLPFAEVRSISNAVADRDVAGWNWKAAFDALTAAVAGLPR
jgi:futalosine hydrolase